MFTGNQLTQTSISIFFQVTLCATKDLRSIHCYEEQKQSHQQTKEGEKKRRQRESKQYYKKTTILFVTFINNCKRALTKKTRRYQFQRICSASMCAGRFGKKWSRFETTTGWSVIQTSNISPVNLQ